MRFKHSLAIACGTALFLAAPAMPVAAGTLNINPVLVEIGTGQRTATVSLRNQEATPVTIRAYALGWRQVDGEDVYDESSAVIVSPPIFTIPAGGTQLIRVGLRKQSGTPLAYRLIVEEVPEANPGGGIKVALRLNLPLYSMMNAGDSAALRWSAKRLPDGEWQIEAVNSGPGYVRLDPGSVATATGIQPRAEINFGTVLPGATRRWRIGARPEIGNRARFEQITRADSHVAARAGSN